MSTDSPRFRLAALGVVVLSLFAALYARLWYLQVLDAQTFVQAAASNQVRLVYEEAPRGRILDRNGQVLVDNQRSQVIAVRKAQFNRLDADERTAVKARLAALLGISEQDLEKRINDVRYSQYKPVPVAENVPEEIFIHVKENQAEFPGVEATIISRRTYPNGTLAAHVLGYAGEINDRELEARKGEDYKLGDTIGKSGVELVYERDLRGEAGVEKLQVNSAGEVLGAPLSARAPTAGNDVQLTLDLNIQRLAEESLEQGLQKARTLVDREERKPFKAPAGSVVVLDVRDGSVVAMASFPTYNPGDFVDGIKPDVFKALNDPASHYPLNNRAITGQYAPGSTYKLVTAIAAAQRGMITGKTTISDPGFYNVPNCKGEKCQFQNAGRQPHGRVDLRRSLTVSSDVYYYQLGARFWLERSRYPNALQDASRDFGLGARTGIPLPTEKAGVIPSPEWKKEFCTKVRCLDDRWFTGDSINMSIGQGDVLVTPLQLAMSYAVFANGGIRFEPRIASRVVASGTTDKVVREEPVKESGRLDLPAGIRDPVLQGLRGVIEREEGTAFYAFSGFPRGFPVAGKTGTAQVRGKQDSAIFAAFAPADNPQYAISVVLEEAGFGGSSAAPIARRILEGIATGTTAPAGEIRVGGGGTD
ncbi:MAG TPA: penicillin-binding protein 2 [Acidimicrobiales bacterium]|jgi:penicillin-binding protein 2|nr:penicillin-binding protein 2 [Acidimicrobiales bacterium]